MWRYNAPDVNLDTPYLFNNPTFTHLMFKVLLFDYSGVERNMETLFSEKFLEASHLIKVT